MMTTADDALLVNNSGGIVSISRKRARSESPQQLSDEFIPLSKRINRLHINNNVENSQSFAHHLQSTSNPQQPHPQTQHNNSIIHHQNNSQQPPPIFLQHPYNPKIHHSQSDYISQNERLYYLYLERLARNSKSHPY